MELIDKFASNNISKIVILPSASKDVSIESADQYIRILNNNKRLNGLKGITKMKNRESIFK